MDREQALATIKQKLKGPRFEHTLGVVKTAIWLADKYDANREKAELAAIFHDYAKLMTITELKKLIQQANADERLLSYHPELWHGPAAAFILENQYKVHDIEILDSIRYHTTGRANMSILDKIIYLADYIEPGRSFPGVEEVRDLANKDLNKAVFKAISNTIHFLVNKKASIFPDTFEAYNHFTSFINKGD